MSRRLSTMMKDYEPRHHLKNSLSGKRKVTIYKHREDFNNLSDIFKIGMRKKINKHFASKKQFLSNSSLVKIQQNTKELTRMMNSTWLYYHKRSETSKQDLKFEEIRPQTTQWIKKKIRKFVGVRPSSDNWNPYSTDSFNNRESIFDQRKFVPSYENIEFSDSLWNTKFKNSSVFSRKPKIK